jgi:hypothetical protein
MARSARLRHLASAFITLLSEIPAAAAFAVAAAGAGR